MNDMDNEYNPDTFPHPSEIIGECLAHYDMTVYSLVSLVDYCPLEYWQKYFIAQVKLTENAAIVLERVLDISRAFWLRLDDLYWQCVENNRS
jgi:plasmid maintenance system antidote protein VapI